MKIITVNKSFRQPRLSSMSMYNRFNRILFVSSAVRIHSRCAWYSYWPFWSVSNEEIQPGHDSFVRECTLEAKKYLTHCILVDSSTVIGRDMSIVRNPGRDISFPIFIRKEIETKKLERKTKINNISFNRLIISFKQYNKSLKRYKNRMEIKTRKTESKLKQQICRWNNFLSFLSNI